VVAVDCVNASNEFFHGRALVQNRVAAEPAALADSRVPLQEFIASPAVLEAADAQSESFHGLRERKERDTVEARAAHAG